MSVKIDVGNVNHVDHLLEGALLQEGPFYEILCSAVESCDSCDKGKGFVRWLHGRSWGSRELDSHTSVELADFIIKRCTCVSLRVAKEHIEKNRPDSPDDRLIEDCAKLGFWIDRLGDGLNKPVLTREDAEEEGRKEYAELDWSPMLAYAWSKDETTQMKIVDQQSDTTSWHSEWTLADYYNGLVLALESNWLKDICRDAEFQQRFFVGCARIFPGLFSQEHWNLFSGRGCDEVSCLLVLDAAVLQVLSLVAACNNLRANACAALGTLGHPLLSPESISGGDRDFWIHGYFDASVKEVSIPESIAAAVQQYESASEVEQLILGEAFKNMEMPTDGDPLSARKTLRRHLSDRGLQFKSIDSFGVRGTGYSAFAKHLGVSSSP